MQPQSIVNSTLQHFTNIPFRTQHCPQQNPHFPACTYVFISILLTILSWKNHLCNHEYLRRIFNAFCSPWLKINVKDCKKHELLRSRLDYCAFKDIVILPTSRAGVSKMHPASDLGDLGVFFLFTVKNVRIFH